MSRSAPTVCVLAALLTAVHPLIAQTDEGVPGAVHGRVAHEITAAIALLEAAHASTQPFEVRIRYAGMLGGGISRADVARIPGVTIIERGDPPIELFAVREGVLTSDGADAMRLETRYIASRAGSPSTACEVWTASENATVPMLEAPPAGTTVRADLYRIDPITHADRAAAFEKDLSSHERHRAAAHYLPMARHIAVVLREDPQTRILASADNAVELESPGTGTRAVIDGTMGALLRVRFTDNRGGATDYEFTGAIDGPGFPARHPAEMIVRHPGGWVSAELYSDFRSIDPPDPSRFTWQTLAASAQDLRTGTTIRAADLPALIAVAAPQGEAAPDVPAPIRPVPAPNTPAAPAPGGQTVLPLSPILLLLGLIVAAVVIGILSIFRRKK